jgi:predicted Zn-dependent peptidase
MATPVSLPLDLPELRFTASGGATVRRTVLPCGVRILSELVPGARSVTLGYWVAVGSRDEVVAAPDGDGSHPASLGSTHFLEHLLFKGTPSRTAFDIAVAFDSVGGEHNALTAKEHTCYYAKVRDSDLEMAVDVMCDMITSSILDPQEFETEREVILEELAMADDDPTDVAQERLYEAVFGAHPLGRPIGGDIATIRAASRDAVVEHYRANYRPEDLVITAAGGLDHDLLVARVSTGLMRAGWDLASPSSPVSRRATVRQVLTPATDFVSVARPIEQANIMIGMPGIVATDPRRFAQSIFNAVLGGGMSSRLFQEIREKRGLVYSVFSFASSYSDAGISGFYAGTSPNKAPEVTKLMMDEFLRVVDSGITRDELARAQGQIAGASALALEDTDTRMSRLGRAEIAAGEFNDYDSMLEQLNAVTVADVRDLATEFASGALSLISVGAADDDALRSAIQRST